jgi:hypothetical protein
VPGTLNRWVTGRDRFNPCAPINSCYVTLILRQHRQSGLVGTSYLKLHDRGAQSFNELDIGRFHVRTFFDFGAGEFQQDFLVR